VQRPAERHVCTVLPMSDRNRILHRLGQRRAQAVQGCTGRSAVRLLRAEVCGKLCRSRQLRLQRSPKRQLCPALPVPNGHRLLHRLVQRRTAVWPSDVRARRRPVRLRPMQVQWRTRPKVRTKLPLSDRSRLLHRVRGPIEGVLWTGASICSVGLLVSQRLLNLLINNWYVMVPRNTNQRAELLCLTSAAVSLLGRPGTAV
jgi:hypothetical protein